MALHFSSLLCCSTQFFFFFNYTAPTEIYTLSLHDALPIYPGDVGYFIANIKTTADIKIGDTITDQRHPARAPLPGFQEIHPMVFSGIYPINTGDFEHLKDRKSTRLNSSHLVISYAVFCLKK